MANLVSISSGVVSDKSAIRPTVPDCESYHEGEIRKLLYFRQMASITLSLPDDLASQIRARQQQLPEILELGLRELNAGGQSGFDGAADVLELLAALPTPDEILNLRPSPRLSARVVELIEKSRAGEMTPLDEEEWERYEYLEHLVRMAKAAAQLKLTPSPGDA
jgi:hypothetical protein